MLQYRQLHFSTAGRPLWLETPSFQTCVIQAAFQPNILPNLRHVQGINWYGHLEPKSGRMMDVFTFNLSSDNGCKLSSSYQSHADICIIFWFVFWSITSSFRIVGPRTRNALNFFLNGSIKLASGTLCYHNKKKLFLIVIYTTIWFSRYYKKFHGLYLFSRLTLQHHFLLPRRVVAARV